MQLMKGMDCYKYECDKKDKVDIYIGKYCNASGLNLDIKRIGNKGLYESRGSQVTIK